MTARLPETRRLAYLQALGISSWIPARPLPGAMPSPELVAEEQKTEEQKTAEQGTEGLEAEGVGFVVREVTHVSSQTTDAAAPVASQEINGEEGIPETAPEVVLPGEPQANAIKGEPVDEPAHEVRTEDTGLENPLESTEQAVADESLELSFIQYAFGETHLFVTLEESGAPGLGQQELALLDDIVLAVFPGAPLPSSQRGTLFHWPLPNLPGDRSRFEEMLLARVKLLQGSGCRCIVVSGETLAACLPQQLVPVLAIPALSAMCQDHRLKRDAWRILSSLPDHSRS